MFSSWMMLLTWLVSLKEFSVAQDLALEDAWMEWKKIYEKVYTDKRMLSSWVMLLTWLVSLKEFSVAQDSALEDAWTEWKKTFGRVYTDQEEASRRATWEKNLKMVEQHNREANKGKHSYWMGMNQFSDWTTEEFSRMLLPVTADLYNASQGFLQAPDVQPTPKPKKCHQKHYGTSGKDQLALAYRGKRSKHHSEKLGKRCLISSNGTKKVLGRRCRCISRYRRRCQKCCKLAL